MSEREAAEAEHPAAARAGGTTEVALPPGTIYCELRRVVFLVAGLVMVYQLAAPLATLLLFFLMVFILAAVLNPVATRLHRHGVPRTIAALLLALLLLGVLVAVAWLALPPLMAEVGGAVQRYDLGNLRVTDLHERLVRQYPGLQQLLPPPEELSRQFKPNLTGMMGRVGRTLLSVGSGVFSLLILLVLVIYTVGRPEPLVGGLLSAVSERYRAQTETALRRCMEQLTQWAVSSLILGGIVAAMTGAGLWLLGRVTGQPIPSILMLSVIAGIGELIPNIGPLVSAVPAILLAATVDPMLALWVMLLFLVVQQLENNLVVPLVMGNSLRLHPVSLIFTMLVMHTLFGILGALLAVPVAAILKVCWEEFYLKPRGIDPDAMEAKAEQIVTARRSLFRRRGGAH